MFNGVSKRGWPLLVAIGCTGIVGGAESDATSGATGAAGGGAPGSGAKAGPGATDNSGAGGSGGEGARPGAAPTSFLCDAAKAPRAGAWRKLTAAQYRNSVRDVIAFALKRDATAASSVLSTLSTALGQVPDDVRAGASSDQPGGFRRMDQSLGQTAVEASLEVGVAVGAALTTPARLGTVVGACATDGAPANDEGCITSFISSFGERAMRRPLDPTEVAFYRSRFYGATSAIDPAGFADVIGALLASPQFMYHVEHGDTLAGKPDVYKLSAFELASRLSFQFWDTMPDDQLFAAAKSGALGTPQGFRAELDRVVADPRARGTLSDLYRDWLKLDDLVPLDKNNRDAVFKAFAGANLPTAALRQSAIDDVLAMAVYHTWDRPGGLEALLTSDLSFARSPELARIYGVAPWTSGDPPRFPPGERPGLLTRAAFLATGTPNTRPVMKGVFVRNTLLCDEIPPPPADAMNTAPPPSDAPRTTRQVLEALTEAAGSTCRACHATLINPIGYGTESFDSLGRLRAQQRIFSAQGIEIARLPVDTRSVPQIVPGDATRSEGAADLMSLIAKSGKAHACLPRQYFRYTFARLEDLAVDGCVLEALRASLVKAGGSDGGLAGMLRQVALTDQFQQRSFRE